MAGLPGAPVVGSSIRTATANSCATDDTSITTGVCYPFKPVNEMPSMKVR